MILELERFGLGRDSTLGCLTVGAASCWTLEDERRKVKVKGETCIPEGEYPITLRTEGGFHERYKKAYPAMHHGMLWLRDVPGFEYILIHQGNTDDDTAGCILLGTTPMIDHAGEFLVRDSAVAYKKLYPLVADALLAAEAVTIRIRLRERV